MKSIHPYTKPVLKTKLPGPKAKAIIDRDRAWLSPSYTRDYPLVAERGIGVWMEDPDGNVFLDCTAGIAVTSTGHCHPEVVKAIQDQAAKLIHMSGTDFYYDVEARLAETLCALMPGKEPHKVYLCNSGTEAIEAAMKLARFATKRPRYIAFSGSFHGRTMGALSLTASKSVQMQGYFPLVPGVTHFPYPDPYRPAFGRAESIVEDLIQYMEYTFARFLPADEVAAMFVEPIQGEGGYVVPPKNFLPELRKLCDKYGILLVFDEVQSGMGRTGKMFAFEHVGVTPDIVAVAKGIASGLPLGATIARAGIMNDWGPGRQGTTFGGNPVACAAALKTIELLQQEYIANAATVGDLAFQGFHSLIEASPVIGDVRGKGLMLGIDIVTDKQSKGYNPQMREKIIHACFHKGLLLLGAGKSTIRFCPPLCISREEMETALDIFSMIVK